MNSLIIGYIAIYGYLFFSLMLSIVLKRCFKASTEASRKVVHLMAGLSWCLFAAFFQNTIHTVVISASFVIVALISKVMNFDFMERKKEDFGVLFFTCSMLIMAGISYFFPDTFIAFGIAIVSLSLGDGMAAIIGGVSQNISFLKWTTLKIYKEKSLIGSVGCFFFMLFSIGMITWVFKLDLHIYHIVFLAFLGTIAELFAGSFDNILIPFSLFFYSYAFYHGTGRNRLLIGLLIGIVFALTCYLLKLVTLQSALLVLFFANIIYYFAGGKVLLGMLLGYFPVLAAGIILKKSDKKTKNKKKTHVPRNGNQIMANCFAATMSTVLYGIDKNPIFLVPFLVAIGESVGDSMASDIGILSKKAPVDICTRKRTYPGLSGGVSCLGTVASICSVLFICGLAYCLYPLTWQMVGLVFLFSVLGIFMDSVIGSRWQVRYWCEKCKKYSEQEEHCGGKTKYVKGWKWLNNSRVNIICNLFVTIISMIPLYWLK